MMQIVLLVLGVTLLVAGVVATALTALYYKREKVHAVKEELKGLPRLERINELAQEARKKGPEVRPWQGKASEKAQRTAQGVTQPSGVQAQPAAGQPAVVRPVGPQRITPGDFPTRVDERQGGLLQEDEAAVVSSDDASPMVDGAHGAVFGAALSGVDDSTTYVAAPRVAELDGADDATLVSGADDSTTFLVADGAAAADDAVSASMADNAATQMRPQMMPQHLQVQADALTPFKQEVPFVITRKVLALDSANVLAD